MEKSDETQSQTQMESFEDLIGVEICRTSGLSYDCIMLINVIRNLLKKDDIPYVWQIRIMNLIEGYDKYGRNEKLNPLFLQLLDWELTNIVFYIERAKKTIRRKKHVGKTLRDLIETAKNEKSSLRNKALEILIGFDPRWLYEPWIQEKVITECEKGNSLFLKRLGSQIACSYDKAFEPVPKKGSKADQLVKYLKKKGQFGRNLQSDLKYVQAQKLPKTLKDLWKEIDFGGMLDGESEISPNYLAKLLKRYNRVSRIPQKL